MSVVGRNIAFAAKECKLREVKHFVKIHFLHKCSTFLSTCV